MAASAVPTAKAVLSLKLIAIVAVGTLVASQPAIPILTLILLPIIRVFVVETIM